jgi:hypothetical protein
LIAIRSKSRHNITFAERKDLLSAIGLGRSD